MREHGRDAEREPAGRPAQVAGDQDETYDEDKSGWADEASTARSASDPRRKAPHDKSGTPTTESLRE
ncbi:hypothetical protein GCM10023322_59870 [Rugosimonospora acidiphila]|uniref:Uncharacterized protein n=1 Tax=Rugosimonospora acidiphila TaxID=556531 RepID=A0ABP9SHA5_9ACTN